MPFGLGDGLASNQSSEIGVNLVSNCLGRSDTKEDSVNKTGFCACSPNFTAKQSQNMPYCCDYANRMQDVNKSLFCYLKLGP